MRADLIGVLEAAYDLQRDEEAWLASVFGALHPVLNRGRGTASFLFTVDETGLHVRAPMTLEVDGPGVEVLRRMNAALPPAMASRLYVDAPPCSTAARTLGMSLRRDPVAKREFTPYIDVPDVLGVRANSAPREGAFFCASLERVGAPSPREAMLFSRLASHIGAGLRLRRRLSGPAPLDEADAVLTPAGKLEHASGPARSAREALAAATRSVDRARGRLRRADPEQAVALWRALVAGQWSLCDHFDHDGRRYVVAHQNQMLDPRVRLRALSDRERQAALLAALGHTNKLIAYDLGVSTSTVSAYLSRAAAKLGVGTRVSLVQVMRSVG